MQDFCQKSYRRAIVKKVITPVFTSVLLLNSQLDSYTIYSMKQEKFLDFDQMPLEKK